MDPLSIDTTLLGLATVSKSDAGTAAGSDANSSTIDSDDYGIITLYEPGAPARPSIDIVFVHGLQGHPRDSWKARKSTGFAEDCSAEAALDVFWPVDLLHKDVSGARILTFGYSSFLGSNSRVSLVGLGHILLADLSRSRSFEESNRPLVFIAHSLGGLVVKSALVHAESFREGPKRSVLDSTKGICFFGTPDVGSSREAWNQAASVQGELISCQSLEVVSSLRPVLNSLIADKELVTIAMEFKIVAKHYEISVFSFYETITTPTFQGNLLIVPKKLAKIGLSNERLLGLRANHLGLVRFAGPEDEGYKFVKEFFKGILDGSSPKTLLEIPQISMDPQLSTTISNREAYGDLDSSDSLIERERLFLSWLKTGWLEVDMIPDACPSTCDWILRRDEFTRWRSCDHSTLGIFGKPGHGKTVLAKYLVERLRNTTNQGFDELLADIRPVTKRKRSQPPEDRRKPSFVIAYFFDDRVKSRRTFADFTRSLLFQLLNFDKVFFRHVYARTKLFFDRNFDLNIVVGVLRSMILDASKGEFSITIVIDALDECEKTGEPELINFVKSLQSRSGIRFILTCRQEDNSMTKNGSGADGQLIVAGNLGAKKNIEEVLNIKEIIRLPPESIGQDLASTPMMEYVRVELEKISRRKTLSEKFRLDATKQLSAYNDFLQVQLVLRDIEIERTIGKSKKLLESLEVPKDTGSLLLAYLRSFPSEERTTLLRSLYFLIAAKSTLSVTGLSLLLWKAQRTAEELAAEEQAIENDSNVDELRENAEPNLETMMESTDLDFDSVVTRYEPLIHLQGGKVTLMHYTFKDFLIKESTIENLQRDYPNSLDLHVSKKNDLGSIFTKANPIMHRFHSLMSEICLDYFFAVMAATGGIKDPMNFFAYAVLYWRDHLLEAGGMINARHKARLHSLLFSGDKYTGWKKHYMQRDESEQTRILPETCSIHNAWSVLAALDLCHVSGMHFPHTRQDLLQISSEGWIPLHFAVANNSIDSIRWIFGELIAGGGMSAVLDVLNQADGSPIQLAVRRGHLEAVKVLLSFTGCPDEADSLHTIAADEGHRHIFSFLWEEDLIPTRSCEQSLSALRSAVVLRCENIVTKILDRKGSGIDGGSIDELCILHDAVKSNSLQMVRELLKLHPNVSATDTEGKTPLHLAVSIDNTELLECLLNAGAKVDMLDQNGQTPLHIASESGFERICVTLLQPKHNANVNLRDKHGRTAIQLAAHSGNPYIVDKLIDSGANILSYDLEGNTALGVAAKAGNDDVVSRLLDCGAYVDSRNKEARTPLHLAVFSGNVPIVYQLLAYGANPNAKDIGDKTPLHLAAQNRNISDMIIKALIEGGADVNANDIDDKTAVDYFLESKVRPAAVWNVFTDAGAMPYVNRMDWEMAIKVP